MTPIERHTLILLDWIMVNTQPLNDIQSGISGNLMEETDKLLNPNKEKDGCDMRETR